MYFTELLNTKVNVENMNMFRYTFYRQELSDIHSSLHLSFICASAKIEFKICFLTFLFILLGKLGQIGDYKYPTITL